MNGEIQENVEFIFFPRGKKTLDFVTTAVKRGELIEVNGILTAV